MNIKRFKPKSRFSGRADVYDKYRPTYPQKIIDIFAHEHGLKIGDVVADVGSGTGKFTELLLDNGLNVYAVEPNAEMRAYAEKNLSSFVGFTSVDGSAEDTTLEDNSVDAVVVAQAFHWFEVEPTEREFDRILKPDGFIALTWNDRKVTDSEFLRSYDELLVKYCPDYKKIQHKDTSSEQLEEIFVGKKVTEFHFEKYQSVDIDSMIGRLKSSSYCPLEDDENFEPLIASLCDIFEKYETDGGVRIEYDTTLFCVSD